MFTSRSEYRLSHRQDNADLRLTRKALQFGKMYGSSTQPKVGHIISNDERISHYEFREYEVNRSLDVLNEFILPRVTWNSYGGAFEMKFGKVVYLYLSHCQFE